MKSLAIIRSELITYLSNISALFWTLIYPILMLALLISFFDRGDITHTIDGFRAQTVIGLITLTIISTAVFGMAQTFCELRSHDCFVHYYLSNLSLFHVTLSIISSRIMIILVYSLFFIYISFSILDVSYEFSFLHLFAVLFALMSACIFSFSLAILLAYYCRNSQTMIAIANVVNLYAIMSSDVFIPLAILPEWSMPFITTSPFYYLNTMMRDAIELPWAFDVWGPMAVLITSGLLISKIFSRRSLYLKIPK